MFGVSCLEEVTEHKHWRRDLGCELLLNSSVLVRRKRQRCHQFLLGCLQANSTGTFIFVGKGWEVEEGMEADGSVSLILGGFPYPLASELSVSGPGYYQKL